MRRQHLPDPARDGVDAPLPLSAPDGPSLSPSSSPSWSASLSPLTPSSPSSLQGLPPLVPTLAAAHRRLAAVRPAAYARTRNAIDGAVTGLSPYITHGLLTLPQVLADVNARQALPIDHKFVYELGWREFFRHVWRHRGDGIAASLHDGPLPDAVYERTLPEDIRQARTGVPVIDQAVRTLYATGTLHNHARMWLASYVVHLRKVHWRAGAEWLYGHLLDGDLASNHLSWQWVAGTGSTKPYLFNADNVARYAPPHWHSPGSVVDRSYGELDAWARSSSRRAAPEGNGREATQRDGMEEPPLHKAPIPSMSCSPLAAVQVEGREVWLVHPWSLGELPADLPAQTLVMGIYLKEFHEAWPWSEARWRFVDERMAALTPVRCWSDGAAIQQVCSRAARVRGLWDEHLRPWAGRWADWSPPQSLFPDVPQRCDSFSQWWRRAVKGLHTADELLMQRPRPAW